MRATKPNNRYVLLLPKPLFENSSTAISPQHFFGLPIIWEKTLLSFEKERERERQSEGRQERKQEFQKSQSHSRHRASLIYFQTSKICTPGSCVWRIVSCSQGGVGKAKSKLNGCGFKRHLRFGVRRRSGGVTARDQFGDRTLLEMFLTTRGGGVAFCTDFSKRLTRRGQKLMKHRGGHLGF